MYNFLLKSIQKPDLIQGFINRTTPLSIFENQINILDLFAVDRQNRNFFHGLLIGYAYIFETQEYFQKFKQLYNTYLQRGGNQNFTDDFGNTVLTTAITHKAHFNLVKYLIEEVHTDVHTVNQNGYTLLDIAGRHQNYNQVISLLRQWGVMFIQLQESIEPAENASDSSDERKRERSPSPPPRRQQRREPPSMRRRR